MTEPTIESLQAEITRLKAHADDLLAERRAEKARREAAETTLATIQTAHDGLAGKLDDLTLTGPVLRELENVVAVPAAVGKKLLEENGIKFVLGNEGVPVAMDGEQEIPLPDLYEHLRKSGRVDWLIRARYASEFGPSGGGAMGNSGGNFSTKPAKEPHVVKPAQNLGLR